MARQVEISLEVQYVPMDEIQTATWRVGNLLLLNILKGDICDAPGGESLPIYIGQLWEVQHEPG